MALHTPLLLMPQSGDADVFYSAQEYRQFTNGLMQVVTTTTTGTAAEGVVPGGLAVTAQSSPNLTVQVASGRLFVQDDDITAGGLYFCWNDATFSPVGSGVFSTPVSGTTLYRIVGQVRNKLENPGAWTTYDWTPVVIAGTAGANTLPAQPGSALTLAQVSITSAQSSITSAQITDLRQFTGSLSVVKPGNTSRTSTTTLTADPDLTIANLCNGATYEFRANIVYSAGTGQDLKATFTTANVSSGLYGFVRFNTSNAITTFAQNIGDTINCEGLTTSQMVGLSMQGTITTGGAGSGPASITFSWAQATSGASPTVIYANSYMRLDRIS